MKSENEEDAIELVGTITDVRPEILKNRYRIEDTLLFGEYVDIDGIQYYVMGREYYEVGTEVRIVYLPKSKVILEIYLAP